MQSNRSDYSHRRQYSDRSSRQWDDYDDRWEERHEPHRVIPQDSYQKYGGDGQGSTERKRRRSNEYSDSPKMLYSKDPLNTDRNRKTAVRRRLSSPDCGTYKKERRRFVEDDEDDYRYRLEPEDQTDRQSPDRFSHITRDFRHPLQQDDDYKYRKTPQDSRHRYRHEELNYRQQHDDLSRRQSFGYHKDRVGHEQSRDRSSERTQSQDRSTKSYAKSRERNESPSTHHEDYHQSNKRFPLNGSGGQSFENDVPNHSAAIPEQKSAMGFQRFLDVLNRGVNVATLNKIVNQTSAEVNDRPCSPTTFMNTADRPWSPSYAGKQQGSHQNSSNWSESERSQRLASPEPRHRSFSTKGRSLPESLQRGDAEKNYFSSTSRSRSPSVEKKSLTPEDEHRRRQMQDVLQAIGMNLGFEELGQMSHRIQERLYGKKEGDGGRPRRESRDRDTRRAYSPRRHSRSSSSRSSFSPLNQEYYNKKDLYSARRNLTEVHQVHEAVEYGQNSSSSTLQESKNRDTYSQESDAACRAFPQNSTHNSSNPSPKPVMAMYSPINSSPLPYPAQPPAQPPALRPSLPPALPRGLPPVLPPALPPNLSHLGPRLFLPRLPPFLPNPLIPPFNIFQAGLPQMGQLLPQQMRNPPLFNLPGINTVQALNTAQKSKTVSRPRCLQVIETKQPG